MTKRVQILGHVAEIANQFVGDDREITVDTDNKELRLHDNVTPGGARILNRDANDERYQGRSVELDGLLGWEPNQRGFTVRLGPQTYRLRELTVDTDQLTIQFGNGYDGNPLIAWASEILTDHSFAGSITFVQEIQADGGVAGNLVGNSLGTHTGNVVGNVTGNLTGNANGNHTGTFTGDVDLRDYGLAMDDQVIQLSWLSQEIIDAIVNSGLPIGSVVAFAGTDEEIPANWRICDGTNGTPDLRNRFIIGAGLAYDPNETDGSFTHNHGVTVDVGGIHAHTGSSANTVLSQDQIPSHRHTGGVTSIAADPVVLFPHGYTAASPNTSRAIDTHGGPGVYEGWTSDVGGGLGHNHLITIDSGGSHNHTADSADASSLPPTYALRYIMKGS